MTKNSIANKVGVNKKVENKKFSKFNSKVEKN